MGGVGVAGAVGGEEGCPEGRRFGEEEGEGVFGDGGPRLFVAPVGGNGEGGGWGVVEVGCRGEWR